jgi:putative endonuclease
LGSWGETYASEYLKERGFEVIERNARTPYGEIDLVAIGTGLAGQNAGDKTGRGRVILFVEVKTRSSTAYGYPEQAITRRKREHMRSAAQAYLQLHPALDGDWRIDVMAIYRPDPQQPAVVNYFENAVQDE